MNNVKEIDIENCTYIFLDVNDQYEKLTEIKFRSTKNHTKIFLFAT